MKRYPSIFNDALAPVTPGPSSSNTCGPARIARTCRRLFGEKPNQVTITMSNKGNYKPSFHGMRTDLAFLTGFLDRDVTHPRFIHAHADAATAGLVVQPVYTDDLPGFPTALAVITMKNDTGHQMEFRTVSCGGGAFYIEEINDCKVNITGDCYVTLLLAYPNKLKAPDEEELSFLIPGFLSFTCSFSKLSAIIAINSSQKIAEETIRKLRDITGVYAVTQAEPVYHNVLGLGKKPPFTDSKSFIKYVQEKDIPLWRAAIEYESAISAWTEDEVYANGKRLWNIVLESIQGGLSKENDINGIVQATAPKVQEHFNNKSLIPLGAINIGAPSSLAIMEYSNCSGVIVCIPTGGSSGVVPGAILGSADALGKNEDSCVKAFLVAGLMGVFMEKTHYLGSYGCQMEIGLATGMAAAGLIDMLNGNAEQACSAAVMCLQSMSGLLCDKIAGLVQVPCISRNMTATAVAMVCANATMSGVETLIPLEEKLESMMIVGKKLIDEKINPMGDMGTPTGRRLAEEQKCRDALLRL